MAEPLSMAASIAGIISLADTVFRYLFKYVRNAAGAKDDIRRLSEEINGLSGVLRSLHALALELEAEGQSYEPTLRVHHLTQCQQTFETVKKRVKKAADSFENSSKWEGLTRQLKWPFSASETKNLLGDISRYKDTIALATSADTMRQLQLHLTNQTEHNIKIEKTLDKTLEKVEISTNILLDSRKKVVLDFFMKPDINPQANLNQSIKLRHPTTGGWLLLSDDFNEWLQNPGEKLWLSGIPGGGKTILAGAVIQEALSKSTTDVGVAFFFCDYKSKERLTSVNILGAIASQLALQRDDSFELLQEYYAELHPARALSKVAEADELRTTITNMSEKFKQTIIIVDGLDECGDSTNDIVESLSELATTAASASMALFSRDEMNIRVRLEDDFKVIAIEAHTEDVESYVRAEMEQRIQRGQLSLNNMALKGEIGDELIKRARGMFRWVTCQLDYICEFATDSDRRQALKELPPTLPDSYRRLLERVNKRPPQVRKMVQMCLQFLAFFPKRLSILELCQAVSTPETIGSHLDGTNTVREREIASHCSSLIRKSADGKAFEFAHFSVREFLEDEALSRSPEIGRYRLSRLESSPQMALRCLRFLQMRNFDTRPSSSKEWRDFKKERRKTLPFYSRAAAFWPMLAREGLNDPPLLDATKSLFRTAYFYAWIDDLMEYILWNVYWENQVDKPWFSIWAAASPANDPLLKPLHVASALNLPEIVSFLIQQGADANAECRLGKPILLAQTSFLDVIEASVGLPNAHSSFFNVAVPSSSRRNRTLEHLIGAGADFSLLGNTERVFLKTAMLGLHVQDFTPVTTMISEGITPTDSDTKELGDYLLSWQSSCEDFDELGNALLSLLDYLKNSASFDTDWGFKLGDTLWSTSTGIGLSFTKDASITDTRISLSEAALVESTMLAISRDDVETLQLYLKDGRVSISGSWSWRDSPSATLLHHAIACDAEECAELLLSLGSDPCAKDDDGDPVPLWSNRGGDGAVLKVLAKYNVSFLDQDAYGSTLWHICASNGYTRQFLDVLFNLDPEATHAAILIKAKDGHTPLALTLLDTEHDTRESRGEAEEKALNFIDYCHQIPQFWAEHASIFPAAFNFRSTRVLRRFVELGLEPDPIPPSNLTPLHTLRIGESLDWIQFLQSMFPTALDLRFEGRLPIELYVEKSFQAGALSDSKVIEALSSESVFKSKDDSGLTPWEFLCRATDRAQRCYREKFLNGGWQNVDKACAKFLSLKAMAVHEDEMAQCGLTPLLSAVLRCLAWLNDDVTRLLSAETIDQAILASKSWDPTNPKAVLFFKQAIKEANSPTVKVLLKHGLDVHQRADGTTSIEFACQSPLAANLCSTDDGKAILQSLLDQSEPERLKDFTPDEYGRGLLHRIAGPSEEPGLGWLMKQILDKGVDINGINPQAKLRWRLPPIVHHLLHNSPYGAGLLLEMGADPNVTGALGPPDIEEGFYDAASASTFRGDVSFLRKLHAFVKKSSIEIQWERHSPLIILLNGQEKLVDGASILHIACLGGYDACAKFFLDEQLIECDVKSRDGYTPLHLAALAGEAAIIEFLVAKGAAVNAISNDGTTPLHFAARNGHLEATRTLLSFGASNSIDQYAMMPSNYANDAGHQGIMKLLDQVFGKVGGNDQRAGLSDKRTKVLLCQMKAAIEAGSIEECKNLVSKGCPLDAVLPDGDGCSPLLLSLTRARSEISEWLLCQEVDTLRIYHSDDNYFSTVEHAAFNKKFVSALPSLLRRYLEDGGDWVNGRDSLLHHAVEGGNEEGLRVILEYLAASLEQISHAHRLPHEEVMRTILNRHFKFGNEFCERTALHRAVRLNHISIVQLLHDNGADIDCLDAWGVTPLCDATTSEMAAFLLKSGASPTPLFTFPLWHPVLVQTADAYVASEIQTLRVEANQALTSCLPSHVLAPPVNVEDEGWASLVALEDSGLISFKDRQNGGGTLADSVLRLRYTQSFFLNSNFRLESLDPFPWHWINGWEFRRLPFLQATFGHFQRRLSPGAFKRWLNLQPELGWSPLCRAASQDLIEVMENCLSVGADIDFEGCPLGSAVMVASACGRLEAVKFLIRRGAACTDRRGSISVFSVARSRAVRAWLLVGRFNDQLRLEPGSDERCSHSQGQTGIWSGVAKARLRLVGWNAMRHDETMIDYANRLARIRREMRGQIAICIDGLIYKDHGSQSSATGSDSNRLFRHESEKRFRANRTQSGLVGTVQDSTVFGTLNGSSS